AEAVATIPAQPGEARVSRMGTMSAWWPEQFGTPSSVGAQNQMRYAFFPAAKRLVTDEGGRVATYDTGEHVLNGVSQHQSGTQTIVFSSASGPVPLSKLKHLS